MPDNKQKGIVRAKYDNELYMRRRCYVKKIEK